MKSFRLGDATREISQTPLSWQQITAAILLCPAIVFGVLAAGIGSRAGSIQRLVGQYGLALTVPALLILMMWHIRSGRKANVYPDVLDKLFPVASIMQSGKCHFIVGARQIGPLLQLHMMVQNLCDGAGDLQLRFAPSSSPRAFRNRRLPEGSVLADIVPPLRRVIAPAAVVLLTSTVPLHPRLTLQQTRLAIDVQFRKSGRQIRFDKRRQVTKAVDPGLGAGLILVGHFHHGGGTFLPVSLRSYAPYDVLDPPTNAGTWVGEIVWSPHDPATPEEIASLLAERNITETSDEP